MQFVGRLAAPGLPSHQFFFEPAVVEHDADGRVAGDIEHVVLERLVLGVLAGQAEVLDACNLVVAAHDDAVRAETENVVMTVVALFAD